MVTDATSQFDNPGVSGSIPRRGDCNRRAGVLFLRSDVMSSEVGKACDQLVREIKKLAGDDQVEAINKVRKTIHEAGPFANEPVDFVVWIKADSVVANDYNPNSVAPPEMELLRHSIACDGYTQPIVSFPIDGHHEVVDGFHRQRVGTECEEVANRLGGYLPLTVIKEEREAKGDRMASTIRHNRARGKHAIDSMSEIVVELKRRNWSDKKIGKELGMDPDEVLRLAQISGLMEAFQTSEFSEAWECENVEH